MNVKDLLAAAAGPEGKGDENWHAARVDRLYFADPNDIDAAGSVDVRSDGEKEPDYVRVELYVRPTLAAQIISLVTGETAAADLAIGRTLEKVLAVQNAIESARNGAPIEPPTPDDPRGFTARNDAANAGVARRDAERREELDKLIAAQDADEASETTTDAEEEEIDDYADEEREIGSVSEPVDLTVGARVVEEEDEKPEEEAA